jgi:hypothetical protein
MVVLWIPCVFGTWVTPLPGNCLVSVVCLVELVVLTVFVPLVHALDSLVLTVLLFLLVGLVVPLLLVQREQAAVALLQLLLHHWQNRLCRLQAKAWVRSSVRL